MVMAKSLTHCNTVAYKQGNIALLSSKIIMTLTVRLNHSDVKPFKAKIIDTQQAKVYNNKTRCANGLA